MFTIPSHGWFIMVIPTCSNWCCNGNNELSRVHFPARHVWVPKGKYVFFSSYLFPIRRVMKGGTSNLYQFINFKIIAQLVSTFQILALQHGANPIFSELNLQTQSWSGPSQLINNVHVKGHLGELHPMFVDYTFGKWKPHRCCLGRMDVPWNIDGKITESISSVSRFMAACTCIPLSLKWFSGS